MTGRPAARSVLALACVLAAASALSGGAGAANGGDAATLRQVLARAAAYSAAYGAALASVVADETFVQELVRTRDGDVLRSRRLDSEIAFVHLAGTTEWLAFRSVQRVDGASVESSGQLERIFREAPDSALRQARAITAASARYHLGPVERNFNVPTTVLQFLLRQHQERFRFSRRGEEWLGDERFWVVDFRERGRATFIRTPEGRPAAAEGTLWLAPDDGRLVRSRLVVKGEVEARIDVTWRPDERLQLWVPEEMREEYRGPWPAAGDRRATGERYDIRGVARYSKFRRFEVEYRIGRP